MQKDQQTRTQGDQLITLFIDSDTAEIFYCHAQNMVLDGRAWWAAVHGVAQSRTWLKQLSSSSSRHGKGSPLVVLSGKHWQFKQGHDLSELCLGSFCLLCGGWMAMWVVKRERIEENRFRGSHSSMNKRYSWLVLEESF